MRLDTEFIKSLLEDERVVYNVGKKLVDIWIESARKSNGDLSKFYYDGEEEAKSFEEFILKAYGEFYRILAQKCIDDPSIFENNPDASFIVMDGMSLREGVLMYDFLMTKGYNAKFSFNFSAIPSETLQFREKIGIPMKDFIEINDPRNIRLSGGNKYIWSYFPDVMLDKIQVGHTVVSSLENLYETAKRIVETIIDKLDSHRIMILSDHGYIRSEAGFVFSVSNIAKRKLLDIFGSKRYISMNEAEADDLVRDGYVEDFAGYYLVKSRYIWPVKGRYSIYLHGGLSLMECFTPVIELER